MEILKQLINDQNWAALVKSFPPNTVATHLTFKEGMLLSRKILENDDWNDNLQTYAIALIKAIKNFHKNEWESNWKHEAYLGYAYDLRGWDYEDQFEAYENAAKKAPGPDSEVLMRLAINWSCPGVYGSKMDEQRAIQLLEEAMKTHPYVEGLSCLIDLYDKTGRPAEKRKWEDVLKISQEKHLMAPYAFLDFFSGYGYDLSKNSV